jgi:hypothetical protein
VVDAVDGFCTACKSRNARKSGICYRRIRTGVRASVPHYTVNAGLAVKLPFTLAHHYAARAFRHRPFSM